MLQIGLRFDRETAQANGKEHVIREPADVPFISFVLMVVNSTDKAGKIVPGSDATHATSGTI